MKVKVGKVGSKKFYHDLTHENTTTSSWGFVQPILVNERVPGDKISLRIGQTCYLAPMSKPTFGRCSIKTYSSFVPIVDLWHPFESFLSGQTYRGADSTYVPVAVPCIKQSALAAYLCAYSEIKVFEAVNLHGSLGAFVGYDGPLSQVSQNDINTIVRPLLINDLSNVSNYDFNNWSYLPLINITSPSSVPLGIVDSDWAWYLETGDQAHYYVVFGYFTPRGKNIRKVLVGCGYQFNWSQELVSLLPLFAYYKAYFDLFEPPRQRTWKETDAFGFLETIEQRNLSPYQSWNGYAQARQYFFSFFEELGQCYYTQNPDYVSAHIIGASLPIATQGSNSFTPLGSNGQASGTPVAVTASGNQPQALSSGSVTPQSLTQNRLDILRKLYYRINGATAIGGRIKAFLRAFYGNTEFEEPESNYIGSQNINVTISELFNQAQTLQGDLGEYVGRGSCDAAGKTFNYEVRQQGFVVSLMTVVPFTRYAQAVNPNLRHISKFDYYTEDFDSITLLPSPKFSVYGIQEVGYGGIENSDELAGGFGNIPNYMEYKTIYNICNGDVSLGSKRNGYLPFTLNKLLPYRNQSKVGGSDSVETGNVRGSALVAGTKWRYIGREAWLGWFDRVFIDAGSPVSPIINFTSDFLPETDDHFIIYNYIDFGVSSMIHPVSESFQTGADGYDIQLEKG